MKEVLTLTRLKHIGFQVSTDTVNCNKTVTYPYTNIKLYWNVNVRSLYGDICGNWTRIDYMEDLRLLMRLCGIEIDSNKQ